MRLKDGRTLGYAEWGDPAGRVVFHFHGNPGGRLERWGAEDSLGQRSIRLITVDRPGIGESDALPGRTVADWANDAAELGDHLGLERFAVVGFSLGGPYAGACAARLADRVAAAGLVSANARMDDPAFRDQVATARFFKLALRAPWAMRAIYATLGRVARRNAQAAHKMLFRDASQVDRSVVDRPEVSSRLMAAVSDATRRGARGLVDDMRTAQRAWGYEPTAISVPVRVWQGRADTIVPPSHAEYWSDAVPNCTAMFLEAQGHFLIEDHAGEILDEVAADL